MIDAMARGGSTPTSRSSSPTAPTPRGSSAPGTQASKRSSSAIAEFATRDEFDARLAQELRSAASRLVCLAGFMRLVGRALLDAFPNAVLNIHPSLLPAFPGVDAQRRHSMHGVKVTGATVHLVTAELDAGPIIVQAACRCTTAIRWRRCRPASSSRSTASIRRRCAGSRRRLAHRRAPLHNRLLRKNQPAKAEGRSRRQKAEIAFCLAGCVPQQPASYQPRGIGRYGTRRE